MPELSEVETVVLGLVAQDVVEKKIALCSVMFDRLVDFPRQFESSLREQKIAAIKRRGKYIIIEFSSGLFLLIHLRMTGKLRIYEKALPNDPYMRAFFELDDGRWLVFSDVRKFGRFALTDNLESYFSHFGLEMVGVKVSVEEFAKRVSSSKRAIKAVLLDQKVVAGVGNIYADEALFRAHIHPKHKANTLTKKELYALFKAILHVFEQAIEKQGSSLGKGLGNFVSAYGKQGKNQSYFAVYQRTGKPCPDCGTLIERIAVASRSTHFCPLCQK